MKSGELDLTQSWPFTHAQHIHKGIIKSAAFFRSEVEQLVAAGGVGEWLTLWRRSREHVYSTPTSSSALTTTNSLDIFISVSSTCGTLLFHQETFVFFFFFFFTFVHLSSARNIINPPLTLAVNSPAVFTHRPFLDFYRHYTRSPDG